MTPTLSLLVLCGCFVHRTRHQRVGVMVCSRMCGSAWGPSRRLHVPYVIPRPGVPRHIYDLRMMDLGDCSITIKISVSWVRYKIPPVNSCESLDIHSEKKQLKEKLLKKRCEIRLLEKRKYFLSNIFLLQKIYL